MPMPRRALTWLLVLALAAAVPGCARWSPGLTEDEARIAAWWCEDLVHGVPRRREELLLVAPSPAMARIATWLAGSDGQDGGMLIPPVLAQRQARRGALAGFLASGWIRTDGQGLVGPSPDLAPADGALAARLADGETGDRRRLDALLLALADANRRQAGWYVAAVRDARERWDRTDGGRPWAAGPSTSALVR